MSPPAVRRGHRVPAIVVLFLAAGPAVRLSAQHVALGPQLLFGDYREVSADLRYRGTGFGAAATLSWKKFGADVAYATLNYEPSDDAAAAQAFDATQLDVRLRYYLTGPVSAELGVRNRTVDPEFEAQSVGAITAGARLSYLLGPGVRMGLGAGLLFGPKFSGGGSASPLDAFALGLGVTVDGLRGRLRVTGDYEFERIGRTTDDGSGEVAVPIQQSLGRVGVAIVF